MTGKFTTIKTDRGYGFIHSDDSGSDIFFHVTSLVDFVFDDSLVGKRCEFDTEDSAKGPRAVDVRPVGVKVA